MSPNSIHLVNVHAQHEGWQIFTCEGSDNGTYQVQRIDDPKEWFRARGVTVKTLRTDRAAWRVVMNGDTLADRMAREFMAEHNPAEFALMTRVAKG